MIATRKYISILLSERARYARVFNIDESRTVYNPLILLHIKGIKNNKHTLKPNTTTNQ